jgi:hypothetical protein
VPPRVRPTSHSKKAPVYSLFAIYYLALGLCWTSFCLSNARARGRHDARYNGLRGAAQCLVGLLH